MTSNTLVVDASVLLKMVVEEEGTDHAVAILESDFILTAPSHALAEVGEGLRRKIASGDLSDVQFRTAAAFLSGAFASTEIAELFYPAMSLTRSVKAGFYDCLYIALADKLDCRLVTADRKLIVACFGTDWAKRTLELRLFKQSTETRRASLT